MKTRALILCVSLLFAVSCSKKKNKVNPTSTETVEADLSTKDDATTEIVNSKTNQGTDTLDDEDKNTVNIIKTNQSTAKRKKISEISENVMTEQERIKQGEAPAEAILYSEEGLPYVDPYYESAWLEKYAKGGTARTIVLENREHLSDELSEVLVVRTNTTPDVVSVELKAARLLKKMQMSFDEYVDYLAWQADDCKEAFDSIYKFAERYKFQMNRSYFTYSSDCNCQRINQESFSEYSAEIIELFRYQRSSGWECPDNYITFQTCMDPTGDIMKYETVKLNFRNANTLNEGDWELYRVKVKQKRLGSKKLEFEVTPLASNTNVKLGSEYNVKKAMLNSKRFNIKDK